jgi:Ni/Fe-hydrogenase subunit HybB-like protein
MHFTDMRLGIPVREHLAKLTFWKVVAMAILAAGLYSTIYRFTRGLGPSTHLGDRFPWGIWIGFDVLCGDGLAAGGFTLAAIVYIFNIRRFEPVLRSTLLIAFLAYILVIVGMLFELGRPLRIWHSIIMWNPRSVMFEVGCCVVLYTTVLALEFAPVVLERFRLKHSLMLMKKIYIAIIILGVLLSTLHQSSLGSLYLIVPYKLYPLWYSPYLPVYFWISAVAAGCAMVIFAATVSARVFNRGIKIHLLNDLARISSVMMGVYLMMKLADLYNRRLLSLLIVPREETCLYWLEIGIGAIAPVIWFSLSRVQRNPRGLYLGAMMVILGFILNRVNVTITGMETYAGMHYFPSWMELSITAAIVTGGFIVFSLAVKHLPIFEHEEWYPAKAKTQAEEWGDDLAMVSRPY